MLICPHCGKPAISWFTKLFLGPARSVKCRECDGKLSVSWLSLIAVIPMIIGGAMLGGGSSPLLGLALIVIGFAIFMYTPLVPR